MRNALVSSVLFVLCLLAPLPVLTADGAIPIWEPTIIAQPGNYIVTRDITGTGILIDVQSDDVTLDLNGFTVESGSIPISIGSPRNNVAIRNGTIRGELYGILADVVTNLTVAHTRISSSGHGIKISDGTGVTLSHNQIEASLPCIQIDNGSGHFVHRNVLHADEGTHEVIRLLVTYNTEISENIITCPEAPDVVGIYAEASYDSLIRDNRVHACRGVGIGVGSRSLVRDNAISGWPAESCISIRVAGDYNHIEGNLMTSHGYGLYLAGRNNVYRRNTARDSVTAGLYNSDSSNTSHGDNYMPGAM